MFPRKQLLSQILRTSEVPKKHQTGPCSRDKKIAIICKACGREMPNGTEIMCVSYGISCWARYSEHQKFQKLPKGALFQRQKDPYKLQSMLGRKCEMALNNVDYVYASYGISCWDRYLEHQKSQKNTKRDLVPETKRSVLVAKHVGGKCQMLLSNVDYVYVSYGISCCDRYLEHQKSQSHTKRDLVPETKRSL